MSIRDQLRRAAGLFVEINDSPSDSDDINSAVPPMEAEIPAPPKTVETLVREAPGPNLDEIKTPPQPKDVLQNNGALDFAQLYTQSGIPAVPFSAEQMHEMIVSLPKDLPLDTKRATVKASLNAMGRAIGATPENIVTDASRKLAALAAFLEKSSRDAAEYTASTQLEIAALQANIEEKRKAIETAEKRRVLLQKLCEAESNQLDDILEFFSLDVPPSKYAVAEKK